MEGLDTIELKAPETYASNPLHCTEWCAEQHYQFLKSEIMNNLIFIGILPIIAFFISVLMPRIEAYLITSGNERYLRHMKFIPQGLMLLTGIGIYCYIRYIKSLSGMYD